MSLTAPEASSSVLAFATTIHLACASLRNHRRPAGGPVSSLAMVSVLLAALPWVFPSPTGLITGLVAHAIWFAACERFAPAPAARPTPPPAPATSSRPTTSRPKGFVQTPVLAVFNETTDIRTFRLARPEGFDFKAGQFLTLRVRADAQDVVRCYSISSPPATRGYLEISVKRQGLVSSTLHSTWRPGSIVSIRPPAGAFCYPAADDRPLLLVAGGIGITPLLSMLRHAVATEPARPVTLLYSARSEDALAFRRDLAHIAERHPQVNIVFAARDARDPYVYPGRIDERLIQTTVPGFAHAVAMICGPQPMIDAMRRLLVALGMPADQVRSEIFEAAVAASGRAGAAQPGDPGHATHRMRCTRSGQAVTVAAGQTLLDAAEAAAIPIDSLCRAGVCGTCRTKVIEGPVECLSAALDDTDRADGYVLACVSHVRGDCAVEL